MAATGASKRAAVMDIKPAICTPRRNQGRMSKRVSKKCPRDKSQPLPSFHPKARLGLGMQCMKSRPDRQEEGLQRHSMWCGSEAPVPPQRGLQSFTWLALCLGPKKSHGQPRVSRGGSQRVCVVGRGRVWWPFQHSVPAN